MLTRQGWIVAIGAAALLVAGRVLGLLELFAMGVVAMVLLVGCGLLVHAARLELEVGRVLHPSRVHVGTPSRVELSVRNLRARRTPVLRLRDPVSGTRGADLLVPPLVQGERTVTAYRLPTDRRGLVRVGPLEVVVGDPFGLVQVVTSAAPEVQLTVLPHVDPIAPLPYTSAHDPQAGVRQLNALGRTGEEFYALRPFVMGDDLRRIHWPSSARLDELLVRQNELPWQGRTTVLLDVHGAGHDSASFERAVSAAASFVSASAGRKDVVRLVTTGGSDSEFGSDAEHLHAMMEHLAVVTASADAGLHRAVELLHRRGSGGALVAVVGEVPRGDLGALTSLRSRFGSLAVVQVDREAGGAAGAAGAPTEPGVVRVTRDAAFVDAWMSHVRMLQSGRARVGAPR